MDEAKKLQLTQDAYDKLRDELTDLEGPARENIIAEIARARAHGDLSENAEYHSAKEQQGLQEARVRQLKSMLENAEVIEATDDGVVKPGMVIKIRHEGDDEVETYLLGLREQKGGDHDILTPESPIGKALLGHSAGETVTAHLPVGERKIEIVEVNAP